jgi:hypothetical protein
MNVMLVWFHRNVNDINMRRIETGVSRWIRAFRVASCLPHYGPC